MICFSYLIPTLEHFCDGLGVSEAKSALFAAAAHQRTTTSFTMVKYYMADVLPE